MDIECISAVTLGTRDMEAAVAFYWTMGFSLGHGGAEARFTSFRVGKGHLNLILRSEGEWSWWGRVIFYVSDVDRLYRRALEAGLRPHAEPRDAEWGERYFHITDADGHELSFARPLGTEPDE